MGSFTEMIFAIGLAGCVAFSIVWFIIMWGE